MSYVFAYTDAHEPGPAEYPDDEHRDPAEEAYWRAFCGACGASPCTWDGTPDGFHADLPGKSLRYGEPGWHAHDGGCTWAGCGPWPDTLRELREPE